MSVGAFQSGAFQTGAFQTSVTLSQFGHANVLALSQSGYQAARSVYLELSACQVSIAYFDLNGNAFTPNAVSYRVDDVVSNFNIVPWTALATPGDTNQVTVTSAQNALISYTRWHEAHQVLFQITDGVGDTNYARVLFDLLRAPGFGPYVGPIGGFQADAFQTVAFQD
jgi:hypothetical protein